MNVLAHLCRTGRQPVEIPIATVYFNGNRGSHFQPVSDSIDIWAVLLRVFATDRLRAVTLRKP
jgi:hypothetical protein